MGSSPPLIRQHLIDPEICIRCNTCEAICPIGAITHDARNYVVRAETCNACMACIGPCPTGAIDNWRTVPAKIAYSVESQFSWDDLPAELSAAQLAEYGLEADTLMTASAQDSDLNQTSHFATTTQSASGAATTAASATGAAFNPTLYGSTLPPWSAAHPYTNLYGPKSAEKIILAKVAGNVRVTEMAALNAADYDTHHIVLDFGATPFPVLEGQSIGVIPPGVDAAGRAHHPRQYSVASPRNGERPGYNNLSLTVKRVLQDHSGQAVRGVGSNYMCDLKVGDTVQVVGPFGSSFLMPNHPRSNIVMICTGTGSAPMRAMTEWRRRLRAGGKFEGGKLMLFFGARTQQELPYFGPLQSLPKDFIDINFAYSRTPGQPRRYVQDALRERSADLAALLEDKNTYIYVCGLKAMEEGVVMALRDIAQRAGMSWEQLGESMRRDGRLHLETY